MNRRLVQVLLLLGTVAAVRPAAAQPLEGRFRTTTDDDLDFALKSEVTGTFRVEGDSLRIHAVRLVIRRDPDLTDATHRRRVLFARLDLARTRQGGWEILREGDEIPVDRILDLGESVTLEDVRTRLALPPDEIDPADTWIVLSVADGTGGRTGWSFARADRTLGGEPRTP